MIKYHHGFNNSLIIARTNQSIAQFKSQQALKNPLSGTTQENSISNVLLKNRSYERKG